MIATVFVYGTLMPGHLRWPLLEPWALERRRTTVRGTLHDTGRGWPAAHFDPDGAGRVPGWAVAVDPGSIADALARLDRIEGIGPDPDPATDLFRRIEVLLEDGSSGWAYEATRLLPGWATIDDWAGRPDQ